MSGALVGLSLLIIGDSHMSAPDSLIKSLPEALVAEGAQVTTYGVCGSLAGDWVTQRNNMGCGTNIRYGAEPVGPVDTGRGPTPSLAKLLADLRPDAVIVELGDTMAAYDRDSLSYPWVQQQVKSLTGVIAAAKTTCFWIGPPWGMETPRYRKTDERVQEMAAFLQEQIWPCYFIDSLKMASPGQWSTRDGMHLTGESYALWGSQIAASLTYGLTQLPRGQGQEGTLQKAP